MKTVQGRSLSAFFFLFFCLYNAVNFFFSEGIFYYRTDSFRRSKAVVSLNSFFLTQESIEASVEKAGGWEDSGVKKATVTELGGIRLSQPLLIAKKSTYSSAICTHLVVRLLDEYWRNCGKYQYSHIPDVLGVYDEGYYYVWTPGGESFNWEFCGVQTALEEDTEFSYWFNTAGISMTDWVHAESAAPHNVIIDPRYDWWAAAYRELAELKEKDLECGIVEVPAWAWTRIDFDGRSLHLTPQKLQFFLQENEIDLRDRLGESKFRLLQLAAEAILDRERYNRTFVEFNELFALYIKEMLVTGGYLPQK